MYPHKPERKFTFGLWTVDSMNPYFGAYTSEKATALKSQTFDHFAMGARGLKYERLDQLPLISCWVFDD